MANPWYSNPSQGQYAGRPFRNMYTPRGTETVKVLKIFQTPDSENFLPKLRSFTYLGGAAGMLRGLLEYAGCKERAVFLGLGRTLFGTVQGVVYTGSYATTVYLSSQIRGGADDHWNHFLGGLMAGVLVAAKSESVTAGIFFACVFGFSGVMFKEGYREANPIGGLFTFSNIKHENLPSRTISGPWTRWRHWGVGEVQRNTPAYGPYKKLFTEQAGGKWREDY